MKTNKIAVAAALVLGLSSVALQPASANDLTNLINRLTGYNGVGTNGLAGNQGLIQSNMSTGLNNIAAQISSGTSSGQLTIDEQASLSAELNRIRSMNDSFMLGGYTNDEVNQLLSSLSGLNSMLSSALSNGSSNIGYGGSIYNNGYYNNGYYNNGYNNGYYGGISDFNSVVSLRNNVRAHIDSGVASGRLSAYEASSLRTDLNRISAQLDRRALRGNLNTNPTVRRLLSLDQRVNQLINDNQYAGRGFYF